MNAFVVVVLIGAFGAGLAYQLAKSRRDRKARDFDRRVQARKLGWNYVGERDGRIDYRFNGANAGVAWSMWYDSDRGDKSPTPKAIWQTANLRTPGLSLVIIGTQRFRMESGVVGRLLMGVVTGVAQSMTGSEVRVDKSEFYEQAIVLEEGSAAFREKLTVAVTADMPRGWIDREVQQLLTEWPKNGGRDYDAATLLEITLKADGLQVVAQRMPEDFASWRHLARLGEAIAERLAARSGGHDGSA